MGLSCSSELNPRKNELVLLKDGTFNMDKQDYCKREGPILVYKENFEHLWKFLQAEDLVGDSSVIQNSICNFLEEASEEDLAIEIELLITYDGDKPNFEFHTKASPGFLKKTTEFLIEPQISLRGKFIRNPVFDMSQSCDFNASGVSLLTQQRIENFEGDKDIKRIMTGNYWLDIQLNYTVLLEWKNMLEVERRAGYVVNKHLPDCVIVASNSAEVSCHWSILTGHSDVLLAMRSTGLKEFHTNRIHMKDISEDGVKAFVHYIYENEVEERKMKQEVALELLFMAHKYDISNLEAIMLNFLCRKPNTWFSLEIARVLYFQTEVYASISADANSQFFGILRDKMLNILERNVKDISGLSVYQELLDTQSSDAVDLTEFLFKNARV